MDSKKEIKSLILNLFNDIETLERSSNEDKRDIQKLVSKAYETGEKNREEAIEMIRDFRMKTYLNAIKQTDISFLIPKIISLYELSKILDIDLELGKDIIKKLEFIENGNKLNTAVKEGEVVLKNSDFLDVIEDRIKNDKESSNEQLLDKLLKMRSEEVSLFINSLNGE